MYAESNLLAPPRVLKAADASAPPVRLPGISALRMFAQHLATTAPLLLTDLAVALAGAAISRVGLSRFSPSVEAWPMQQTLAWVAVLAGCLAWARLYPGTGLGAVDEMRRLVLSILAACGLFWVAALLQERPLAETPKLLALTASCWLVGLPLARRGVRALCARCSWWGQPVLIFGSGVESELLYDSLRHNRSLGYRPIGILAAHESGGASPSGPHLGPPSLAQEIARTKGVGCALLAMPQHSSAEILRFIDQYCCSIPHLLIVPDRADRVLPPMGPQALHGLLGVRVTQHLLLPGPQLVKRAMDLALTIVGGLLLLPLIAAIALTIRLSSPGPAFYSQRRVGFGGRHFRAWKFRTMVVDAEQQLERHLASSPALREEWLRDHKLRNDPRVTAIGRLLRKTSLDELPQLLNVLLGQMSLVGPRPIVDEEIAKYGESYRLYLRVRPGLTGLWQVSGRNDTGYQQRVQLDMHYVRNWSPWLDIHLLSRTLLVVAGRKGAY